MSVTGDVVLHHLVKWLFDELLHHRVSISPFVISKYHGGDPLRLCDYPASPQTFFHILMDLATIITVKHAYWLLCVPHSSYIYSPEFFCKEHYSSFPVCLFTCL